MVLLLEASLLTCCCCVAAPICPAPHRCEEMRVYATMVTTRGTRNWTRNILKETQARLPVGKVS